MTEVYTTEQLIQILNTERHACLKGDRLNLRATSPTGSPVLDYFLKGDGIQRYAAYQDFKALIHEYQQEHQVSGLVWRELRIDDRQIRYPEGHPQLLALPEDLNTLRRVKPQLLEFWQAAAHNMDLHLAVNRGKEFQPIELPDVATLDQQTEWAALSVWERSNFRELVLQLGWGQPQEAAHWRNWPDAGSEYIHAVTAGQKPICAL